MAIALLISFLSPVRAEEESILVSASVDTTGITWFLPNGETLLYGSFKSLVRFDTSNDIRIDLNLPQQKNIITVFIFANDYDKGHADSIGGSEIVLVDVNGTEVVAKTGVFDTGIYKLD